MSDSETRTALVFGSAMIDVIVSVAPDNIEQILMRNEGVAYLLLEQGRKVPAESISSHVGGGGCNVSTAMARLGWRARTLAKLGADLNAQAVREHLTRNEVDDSLLRECAERATGVSVMVASHERNAAIFVHRGANEHLTAEDIAPAAFDGARLVYIAPLSSASADRFPEIVARAREVGAFVAANPGIRQLSSRGDAFFESVAGLDLLSLNAVEAAALAPGLLERAPAPSDRSITQPDGPPLWRTGVGSGLAALGLPRFFAAMAALGPRFTLLTDGARGAYLGGADGVVYCPPAPVEPQSTAGAGDAMCATCAALIAEGEDPRDALAMASVNAASVVGRINTTDGLLSRDALAARTREIGLAAVDPGAARAGAAAS